MRDFDPYLYETRESTQFLTPPPAATPEGWMVPPGFHRLPGDIVHGVPIVAPGPNGWMLTQYLRFQARILNPVEITQRQQPVVRELLARVMPLLDLCVPFALTAEDIREKTRGFHKRGSSEMLFAEYVVGIDEDIHREHILMLHVNAMDTGLLTIFDADCHRDCLPNIPVTQRDYLQSLQKAAPTRRETELEAFLPYEVREGSSEWAAWMALHDLEQTLFHLRRRTARAVVKNQDDHIPPPVGTPGEMKAVYLEHQKKQSGSTVGPTVVGL